MSDFNKSQTKSFNLTTGNGLEDLLFQNFKLHLRQLF